MLINNNGDAVAAGIDTPEEPRDQGGGGLGFGGGGWF